MASMPMTVPFRLERARVYARLVAQSSSARTAVIY